MSSSSDQRRHEVDTSGSPNMGDRRSSSFDEVFVEYERFAYSATTRRGEVTGSSTSSRMKVRSCQGESAEVSTSGGHDESEGANDSFLAVLEGLQIHIKGFLFPSSVIKRDDLVGLVRTFHFPMGHRVLIPRASDRPTYPPLGYVAVSSHHLIAGLRFPLPQFLMHVFNPLELAPM
ncbi:hypothetical protein ACOSQ2_032537 [Xanthoceras sorbifolium]